MADEGWKSVGEDGIFKLLTWRSLAIARIFNLPPIKGEPLQQEFSDPVERRVDRLYRLEDDSLLNIEHQSSLGDRDALARRMAAYRMMIRGKFRRSVVRQVVVFTGPTPRDRRRIGNLLRYEDVDGEGNGIAFTAAVRDFLSVPVDVFRESGEIDDYILGILASGGRDRAYVREVEAKVRSLSGEAGRAARAKFVAVCVIRGAERAVLGARELNMWMRDVKDNPVAKMFIEIAGKERIDQQTRRALARALTRHAAKQKLDLPEDAENLLTTFANEESLYEMIEDMASMTNFSEFVSEHGVSIPPLEKVDDRE